MASKRLIQDLSLIPPLSSNGDGIGTTMQSTAHFEGLPVETLERIFLELHYFDICTVKLVSSDVDIPVLALVDDSHSDCTRSSIALHMTW